VIEVACERSIYLRNTTSGRPYYLAKQLSYTVFIQQNACLHWHTNIVITPTAATDEGAVAPLPLASLHVCL
jgi:hypothetical protein